MPGEKLTGTVTMNRVSGVSTRVVGGTDGLRWSLGASYGAMLHRAPKIAEGHVPVRPSSLPKT
jgi:hypothetical protein